MKQLTRITKVYASPYKVSMTVRAHDTVVMAKFQVTALSPALALIKAGQRLQKTWPNAECTDVDVVDLDAKVIDVT